MKRTIAIFFLFTFLSANTMFGEVIKLPALIQHYLEHEDLQGDISFINFLKEHYTNPSSHPDIPHHHHDNLPFKTLNAHTGSVILLIPNPIFSLNKQIFPEDNTIIPTYFQSTYSDAYLNGIWQPPRLG